MGSSKAQPEHVDSDDLRDILSTSTAFKGFSEKDFSVLAQHSKRVFAPSGTHLVGHGDNIENIMLIEYGRILVIIPSGSGETIRIECERGQPLGLTTAVGKETIRGNAYALRDSKIILIHRKAFLRCIAENPELIEGYSKWALEQALLLIGHTSPKNRPLTYALLPISDSPQLCLSIELLNQAITDTIGEGRFLDSQNVSKSLGSDLSDTSSFARVRPQLAEWIEEQEAEGHFSMLVCDPSETKWTQWCLNQSNLITVMAMMNDTSEIERIDSMFAQRKVAGARILINLVLIHENDIELPSGTTPWTNLKCLARHHHVRIANKSDFQRIARWITARPVGLTLGGGGARGFAHIGVLQALEDRNIPIDAIGGTSMGAVIAGAYARGWPPNKILEVAKKVFSDTRAVLDLNIPIISILAGRKLNRKLRTFFDDTDISDLWLPYFCISASLSAGEMIVHDHGPLWQKVRASCSLPGIFPPVRTDGHLLVDGGVMNNVPLDVMERWCKGGKVIAVNVGGGGAKDFANSEHWDDDGWRLLRHSLTRRNEHIANILDVMMWSTTLSSKRYLQQLVAQGRGDLYLAPPVQDFQLLGFDAIEQLYNVGYDYAAKKLDEWDGLSEISRAANLNN